MWGHTSPDCLAPCVCDSGSEKTSVCVCVSCPWALGPCAPAPQNTSARAWNECVCVLGVRVCSRGIPLEKIYTCKCNDIALHESTPEQPHMRYQLSVQRQCLTSTRSAQCLCVTGDQRRRGQELNPHTCHLFVRLGSNLAVLLCGSRVGYPPCPLQLMYKSRLLSFSRSGCTANTHFNNQSGSRMKAVFQNEVNLTRHARLIEQKAITAI